MNVQQAVAPRSSANGFSRRRVDREAGARIDNRMHSGKPSSANFGNSGLANGSKIGDVAGPLRDRLVYVMTHLVGQRVEVLVKNGSVISGIFHSANADKDFGVVLKMAQVIKDGSIRGQKPINDIVKRPQTMIIPARELVQILAKEASLSSDELMNGQPREKRKDLLIDSVISHSHQVEVERELERWTPDENDPACPELDNIFDKTWNRNWDQFETNETLFGVKSTFNEELYTTKLERGPQMRELEVEASRIAREIEGEETHDPHLAEERGVNFHENFDLDEESRYSAVRREVDDGSYEENESSLLDTCNAETSGGSFGSVVNRSYSDVLSKKINSEASKKVNSEAQASSTFPSVDEDSQFLADKDVHVSTDHVTQPTSNSHAEHSSFLDDKNRLDKKKIKDHDAEKSLLNECADRAASEQAQTSKSEDVHPSVHVKLPPGATTYDPSSSVPGNKCPADESSDSAISGKLSSSNEAANPSLRPGSSTSSTSDCVGAGGPGLSPSSSVGSLSSEKSTLNPNAKEFKLNPNAKSFMPSAPLRPHTPVDGSFYYASNMPAVPHMHGIPVGVGIGPSFGAQQPVVYNPQAASLQSPQAYIHPNAPLYGQQMILGQSRPVYYMPTYPPEMPYKGRNF